MARFTIDVPDGLVPRFRAALPAGLTPEEAVVLNIKQTIYKYETEKFDREGGRAVQVASSDHKVALKQELGLP